MGGFLGAAGIAILGNLFYGFLFDHPLSLPSGADGMGYGIPCMQTLTSRTLVLSIEDLVQIARLSEGHQKTYEFMYLMGFIELDVVYSVLRLLLDRLLASDPSFPVKRLEAALEDVSRDDANLKNRQCLLYAIQECSKHGASFTTSTIDNAVLNVQKYTTPCLDNGLSSRHSLES